MPKSKSDRSLEEIRHSLAHLLAAAVVRIHPEAKLATGPTTENGFYYDFLLRNGSLSEKDFPEIERVMRKILKEWDTFQAMKVTVREAQNIFKNKGKFKLELIEDITSKGEKLTIYYSGPRGKAPSKQEMAKNANQRWKDGFFDLCRGGHAGNPKKEVNPDAFRLTSLAGAYWKGDEKNPQLQRIYGVAFHTKKELDAYLARLEEAKARDHRRIGRELDLFTTSDLVGPGLPLFTPRGTLIRRLLTDFVEGLERDAGYREVWIPHIAKPGLYKVSGHLEKFGDDLFYVRGKDSEFVMKPMNCPHHIQIYKSKLRSYKDLPIRYFQTTAVYRDEQTGELGGLTRVRSITQDDGHAFLRDDQLEKEFELNLKIQQKLARAVALKDYWVQLSLRDEKNKKAYLGDDATWKKAQSSMEAILKKKKIAYVKAEGEAAFYGPKMDFMARDSLGREWQFSTIQIDLNMPKRFGIGYIDKDGSTQTPVMIHRAFMGSVERFIGILIEHFGGAFPVWLSPEQVWILPVSRKHDAYAKRLAKALHMERVRAIVTPSNETLGKRIREGEVQKIPYLLVVGDKEAKTQSVAVRKRGKRDVGTEKAPKFIERITREIAQKK